jgi:hypothetical protein
MASVRLLAGRCRVAGNEPRIVPLPVGNQPVVHGGDRLQREVRRAVAQKAQRDRRERSPSDSSVIRSSA